MRARRTGDQRVTTIVGGLPSSGTRVAAEALAHLGAKGWGDAAWDSGVGCCEAMGLLARRVRATKALPTSRSFLSRSDSAALDGILRKQLHTYRRGRLTKFHARTADGGDTLLVKEPELSLLLPWLASIKRVLRPRRPGRPRPGAGGLVRLAAGVLGMRMCRTSGRRTCGS